MAREHDIALLGATGFTGSLTAEYLARHAPASTRWALAGRSITRLEALRARLTALNPACACLPLLHADLAAPESIRSLAASTRVAVTAVGPYLSCGEQLVAACAASGTDYLDITGESEFVDRMYVRYHELAVRTGARLVHGCGFESAAYDLGAMFAVAQLATDAPVRLRGVMRLGLGSGGPAAWRFSGGSVRSAVTMLSRPVARIRAGARRRRVEARSGAPSRRVRTLAALPRYERSTSSWLLPIRTLDSETVGRSARALDRYGPDFAHGQYLALDSLPGALAVAAAAAGISLLLPLVPVRERLLRAVAPGSGPTPAEREQRWFRIRYVAEAGAERIVAEVAGGDPGYDETSKILAESSLCLAHDQLPARSGQLTPAVAMGEALIGRVRRAGLMFATAPGRAAEPQRTGAGADASELV